MIWFACNIVSTVVIYLFLPETKGKTMEEMGDLFGDTVVTHLVDGHHLIELEKGGEEIMVENTAVDGKNTNFKDATTTAPQERV